MIEIYTDGSCIKQGPGGFAFVIIFDSGEEWYYSEGENPTTNNRMELRAVIESLKFIEDSLECKIYTDSKLTINCAQRLWKRNANLDLWSEYDNVSKNIKVHFEWVKGHSGNKYNEIVDKMALNEAKILQHA